MADLSLNLVFGSHPGRFQPIFDGRVKPEGIKPARTRSVSDSPLLALLRPRFSPSVSPILHSERTYR